MVVRFDEEVFYLRDSNGYIVTLLARSVQSTPMTRLAIDSCHAVNVGRTQDKEGRRSRMSCFIAIVGIMLHSQMSIDVGGRQCYAVQCHQIIESSSFSPSSPLQ